MFGFKFSKKLFMAICTAILIVLNEGLGMQIPSEIVLSFMAVVATYIFGQSMVDIQIAKKKD